MDEFTYRVAGIEDTATRELTRARAFAPGVTVRRSTLDLPGRHGTVDAAAPVLFDDGKLSLTWELTGETWAAVEAERAALVALLARPGDVEVTRVVGEQETTAAHRLVSISDAKSESGMPLVAVTAVLSAPSVFWRGEVAETDPIAATSGTVLEELAILAGCTAPVVDALVRVAGPATAVVVTDRATGTGVSWSGSGLVAGMYLFIDAAQLRAWLTDDADAWTPAGEDVTAGVDYPTAGPLQLWPAPFGDDPADRRVTVGLGGSGRGATTAVTVRARPAYL